MTIARIWRGATRAEDRDRYVEYLEGTGIADYLATPGNRGVEVLTRIEGDRAIFTIRTLWESLDAIRAFAGDDVETARFYPEDDAFLVDRELRAEHHEVAAIRHPAHAVAYHERYYAAFVLDPDGNNAEAVCHLDVRG